MTRVPALALAICIALAVAGLTAARAQTAAPPAAPAAPAQAPPSGAPPTGPPPEQPTLADDKQSIEAGQKWLALIDGGKAGAAWDSASKQLQSQIKRDRFVAEMRAARKGFGKLASRTPVKFARAHDLPGALTGDYAIVEFEAKFANGKRLTEQLIWSFADGDVWRVAGYYYR